SSGQIRIEAVGGEAVDGFVLYDVYGRILGLPPFQKAMQGGYVLDLSQFSSGVYYLSPQGKDLFELQRIVISR
ncbi:MAG: T9SS type A sorting domain-containing protein, partial [Flavobacteriales bacterium]|nr:T9SS type A sorting domain-containing protein [Flavobacteriales bacterium]